MANRSADVKPGAEGLRQFAIVFGAFLVYALFPTRNYNYADDSLRWAYELTRSGDLINSHHLSLNAMRWLYQSLHGVGVSIEPASLLSLYAAFWGAIGLLFLYRLLKHANLGGVAILGVLVCAFSVDYWSYSIVGDVYVPAIALMLGGLDMFYCAMVAQNRRLAWSYGVLSSALFFLMLAHHQAHAAFVIGLIPAALLLRGHDLRRRLAIGLGVPAATAVCAAALYAGVYSALPQQEQQGFFRFCAGYAESFDARPDQKKLGLSAVVNAAAGEARALVSTNVLFRSEKIARAINDRYPYRNTYPFPYLVRNLSPAAAVAIAIAAGIAALLGFWFFFKGLAAGLRERGLLLLAFVPMVPQALFFMWWEGLSDEFAIWTLPLVALFVARGALATRRPAVWLSVVAASLFVSTLFGSIALYQDQKNDVDAVNDGYVSELGPNDFIVGFEDIQSYHRICLLQNKLGFGYFDVRSKAPHWSAQDVDELDRKLSLAEARGQRIHVAPGLQFPAESQLAFMRTLNPTFDAQRVAILSRLRRVQNVDWVRPAVFLSDYFHKD
jgi:hypothetical protein